MKALLLVAFTVATTAITQAQGPFMPAIPIEISASQSYPYRINLLEWYGSWTAPQAIWDRGAEQDNPNAWTQTSDNEGSTWYNAQPNVSYGILVVDLKQVRQINRFSIFQMMDSDGKTTAVSIFSNPAATGDIPPFADSKGWTAVVKKYPVGEGINNGNSVTGATSIVVPAFFTRYLMIYVFNDGSLGNPGWIELKGIKAFNGESPNLLRGGPALIFAKEPKIGGFTTPATGDYPFTVGVPVDISATTEPYFTFAGWTVEGNATLDDSEAITTTVTVNDNNGARVTANFTMPRVACGSTPWVQATEVGIATSHFTVKPKVYANFTAPLSGKPGKAAAKVFGKPSAAVPANSVQFEVSKKIPLYSAKSLKSAEARGISATDFIVQRQRDLPLYFHATGSEIPGGDQLIQARMLTAPQILTATLGAAHGISTVTMEGFWFGNKLKVWREYGVDDPFGITTIKRQFLKVVTPTADDPQYPYRDSKGKPAFMDPNTGASRLVAILPPAPADGELNGRIVIDNGVGLGTVGEPEPPTAPPAP